MSLFLNCYNRDTDLALKEAGFGNVPTSYKVNLDWVHVLMWGVSASTIAVIVPLQGGFIKRLFERLVELLRSIDFAEGVVFHESEGEIHFPNGGRIYFATRSNLDRLRGYDLKAIFVA
jgi:hypothetical protein